MNVLLIISIASSLVPTIVGIWKRHFNLLWYYTATGFLFDILNSYLKRVAHINNGLTANLFILVEFFLFSFIYRRKVFKNNIFFILFIAVLPVLFLYDTLKGMNNIADVPFNMLWGSYFLIIYIFYGVLGFYTILKEQKVIILGRSSFFWLNVAILIYSSGAFLLFLFKPYLVKSNIDGYMQLWKNVFCIVNTIKYFLIAIAIYYSEYSVKREFT
ncbi:MAG TPA: hypothetical protein VHA52_08130 [Candidatus Babeliaceae bacterium]|nr:hypothetical protein [Candidatus Babeliaceae bacterium]